jgi:hypothetical protein
VYYSKLQQNILFKIERIPSKAISTMLISIFGDSLAFIKVALKGVKHVYGKLILLSF